MKFKFVKRQIQTPSNNLQRKYQGPDDRCQPWWQNLFSFPAQIDVVLWPILIFLLFLRSSDAYFYSEGNRVRVCETGQANPLLDRVLLARCICIGAKVPI